MISFRIINRKKKSDFQINDNKIEYTTLRLPHWFLNIDEWALLLQVSDKTQLPILRSALGFSQGMTDACVITFMQVILCMFLKIGNPLLQSDKGLCH